MRLEDPRHHYRRIACKDEPCASGGDDKNDGKQKNKEAPHQRPPKDRDTISRNRRAFALMQQLVGGLGFEPRQAESESAVLPLDDPPTAGAGFKPRLETAQAAIAFAQTVALSKGPRRRLTLYQLRDPPRRDVSRTDLRTLSRPASAKR